MLVLKRISNIDHTYIDNLLTRVVGNRFEVIHLSHSDFEYYVIGIQDGERKRILFADEENVELVNKSFPSLIFKSSESFEEICLRFVHFKVAPANSEERAWMAVSQGSKLCIAVPNPAAQFAWPFDEEIAAQVEAMEFE